MSYCTHEKKNNGHAIGEFPDVIDFISGYVISRRLGFSEGRT